MNVKTFWHSSLIFSESHRPPEHNTRIVVANECSGTMTNELVCGTDSNMY